MRIQDVAEKRMVISDESLVTILNYKHKICYSSAYADDFSESRGS